MLKYFTSTYLAARDIHSLASTFDAETRRVVFSAYFRSLATLKGREIDASIPEQPGSALLAAALSKKASIFALFGGQGTNEVYFDELQNLYDIYTPFVAPFVQTLTKNVLAPLAAGVKTSAYYTFGLDVASWLPGATTRPPVPYLADQSKTPFSQRKPVFSIRFLIIGVPYHSEYLNGVTDLVAKEDLNNEELWEARDLKIPVYNTENGNSFSLHLGAYVLNYILIGSDMRELKSSITRSLCDQIFTSPIHWTKATNFPETATHAIDFGPGGLSGIGPLTARNFDGRGVRVVVAGEKGKGDVELFNSLDINYEACWNKRWSPGLVRTR